MKKGDNKKINCIFVKNKSNMDKSLEIASKIVENIVPSFLPYIVWESEIDESGNYSKLYSNKAQEMHTLIVNLLEKEYGI